MMIMGVAEKSVSTIEFPAVAVVERFPDKEDQVLHLAIVEDTLNGEKKTVCGRPFDHQTRIPFSSWGSKDRTWCKWCKRGLSKDNLRRRALRKRRRIKSNDE